MSAPKTGIKAIDNTVSAATDLANNATNAINSGVNGLRTAGDNAISTVSNATNQALDSTSNTIRDAVAGAYKNVERNTADTFNGLGAIAKGDFRGGTRTLINAAVLAVAPAGFLANPEDVDRATGTVSAEKQITADALAKAAEDEAAALAYAQESAMNDIRSTISGQISARRRSPGRESTLLNSAGYTPGSYTLLSSGS